MDDILHIVEFGVWCPKCEHYEKKENESPCDECLLEPVNAYSRRPVHWKQGREKEQKHGNGRKL